MQRLQYKGSHHQIRRASALPTQALRSVGRWFQIRRASALLTRALRFTVGWSNQKGSRPTHTGVTSLKNPQQGAGASRCDVESTDSAGVCPSGEHGAVKADSCVNHEKI